MGPGSPLSRPTTWTPRATITVSSTWVTFSPGWMRLVQRPRRHCGWWWGADETPGARVRARHVARLPRLQRFGCGTVEGQPRHAEQRRRPRDPPHRFQSRHAHERFPRHGAPAVFTAAAARSDEPLRAGRPALDWNDSYDRRPGRGPPVRLRCDHPAGGDARVPAAPARRLFAPTVAVVAAPDHSVHAPGRGVNSGAPSGRRSAVSRSRHACMAQVANPRAAGCSGVWRTTYNV